ncbi:unnamed protein product [Eruca vesicaria subsp. sativa]|uniref:Uncharacterized protein n=1 Tax=Eruca vesicaria subsp. sativa TaxID=29727 RepID=A0ABC8J3W8_ERUVS|nr:unnamed protein product [Eruca vesicaria subsp. sativa]
MEAGEVVKHGKDLVVAPSHEFQKALENTQSLDAMLVSDPTDVESYKRWWRRKTKGRRMS